MAVMTYREALNLALREEMRRDPRVFVMGEEVGLYEGAYKVTQGLLKEFGEKRIIDTPICESGFTGVGVGSAMLGLRPVIEMMTFNFSILALDQIVNSAAKLCYMSGGQYNIPLVVRGPGGPASQLAAQHSQSMEVYFYHVPGLKVVRPSTPADAKGLLKSAIRDDNPVIFIESETLYAIKGEVPDDPDFLVPLGRAAIRREGTDVTVIAYMGMLYRALEVAEELAREGISMEIVDPRTLRPMDTEGILNSVRKTHRCVVIEAGAGFAGMGSEIAAEIQEEVFDELDGPVVRVTGEAAPMPYARNLELLKTPSMAKLSEAMETGKVIKWLKKEGDPIKGGDVIAEIETDKANVEIEAFGSGVLRKILVGEGGQVPVGETIGVIADPADDIAAVTASAPATAPAAPVAAAAPPSLPAMESYRSVPETTAVVPLAPVPSAVAPAAGGRIKASPLARKVAAQSGVDLRLLQGTGPGGRIVRRDVESAAASPGPAAAAAAPAAAGPAAPAPARPQFVIPPRTGAEFEDRPLSSMRAIIAKRMPLSKGPVPHFYVTSDVSMDRAWALRAELNALEGQPKVSVTDMIVKACAQALLKNPGVNAQLQGPSIRVFHRAHSGLAIALDEGLITAVLRDCDEKPLGQIAVEARDVAERARGGKLRAQAPSGATFSISNLGMYDGEEFSAIINPPEGAILAVGSVLEKPVVEDGQLRVGRRMKMTLSCDHRVMDGAMGARFLQDVKRLLEEPLRLLV